MSACKTGCGIVADSDSPLFCAPCLTAWQNSPERRRIVGSTSEQRDAVAVMDFCTRVRLERLNGAKR